MPNGSISGTPQPITKTPLAPAPTSEPSTSGVKEVSTKSFFGRIVGLLAPDRSLKQNFLSSIEQVYGPEFRAIAEQRVDPNSWKPLSSRAMRDVLAELDTAWLAAKGPSQTFDVGESSQLGSFQVTGSTATSRSQLGEAARLFTDKAGCGVDQDMFGEIADAVSQNRESGSPEKVDQALLRQWGFAKSHGTYGAKLIEALSIGPGEHATKKLVDVLGDGLSDKVRAQLGTDPAKMMQEVSDALDLLRTAAKANDPADFEKAARAVVTRAQELMARIETVANALGRPELMDACPGAQRSTLRELSLQYRAIHTAMCDLQGPVQGAIAFAAECIDKPAAQLEALRGQGQPESPETSPTQNDPGGSGKGLEIGAKSVGGPLTLTASVAREREDLEMSGNRFSHKHGFALRDGGQHNVFADLARVLNAAPGSEARTSELGAYVAAHGDYGSTLIAALADPPDLGGLKAAAAGPLEAAFRRALGLGEDGDVGAVTGKLGEDLTKLFDGLAGKLDALGTIARGEDHADFGPKARELLTEAQALYGRIEATAEALADPALLEACPPEHRQALEAARDRYGAILAEMSDLDKPFQGLIGFAVRGVESPDDVVRTLRVQARLVV